MKTIYQTIKAIAAPIVRSFQTDVTVHDRRSCGEMKTGDVAFWAAREMGSHFVSCVTQGASGTADDLRSIRFSLEHFEACQNIYPGMQWYMLESTNGPYGHVVPVEPAFIRETFKRRIDAMERIHAAVYSPSPVA